MSVQTLTPADRIRELNAINADVSVMLEAAGNRGPIGPPSDVYILRGRITTILPAGAPSAAAANEIDAAGRVMLPGLFDMHGHVSRWAGGLDLAAGVTTTRDMANDTDAFLKRVARFDDGTEIGPRVLKAGIIDGTGELAGPTKMRVVSRTSAPG